MICQPLIFKKVKKVGEKFEQTRMTRNIDLNVHVCPNTAYIGKKDRIRIQMRRINEGEMKEKNQTIVRVFYELRLQKDSKTVKKSSEKVLTGSRDCDIITELSARAD